VTHASQGSQAQPAGGLAEALDFRLSQVLGLDLLVGLLGGGGSVWLAVEAPERLSIVIPIAATVVGIVMGAVIAAVAILAAFLDQTFLRKLRAIGREPVRYVRPFLFTSTLGLVAMMLLLVLSVLPLKPVWLVASASGLAGTLVFWMLASVLPNLDVLVQFIALQFDASDVPDLPTTAGHDPETREHSPGRSASA
jgi:hypothetical protein